MVRKARRIIVFSIIISAFVSGCSNGSTQSNQNSLAAAQPGTSSITDQASASSSAASGNVTPKIKNPVDNSKEKPVAPEKNPPGDIPDSQVFIKYTSTSGKYELQLPEGWARTENGTDVKYVDKLDGIQVKISTMNDAFTIDNIKKNQIAVLEKTGRAIKVTSTKQIKLSGGQAILIGYESNSEPDPVTNKQVRLENESIYLDNNGKLAEIILWAPLGADNADQWNLISNSFRWR